MADVPGIPRLELKSEATDNAKSGSLTNRKRFDGPSLLSQRKLICLFKSLDTKLQEAFFRISLAGLNDIRKEFSANFVMDLALWVCWHRLFDHS
ncbi:hypothetical protein N7519_003282 [Penicillium mononematosum]|uniref:uncharacterized protein n=1 Tax=Penicillium mononematosum TaxID=268346 RepID=UPI0025468DC6|nr:uncharacterized protein N7519_003282 [Penicillium mononematosum]KAJ6188374.1 hypothetical protein N7519_003282 [Penicillium mononematosum]